MDTYHYDLGAYSRLITTSSPAAQIWFDRGLNWTFGYHHEEAVVCFQRALVHDPDCAMAHWGVAYAAGPNYNMPWLLFDETSRARALAVAYDATQAALALSDRVTPPEAALIAALPARYPQRDLATDQKPWDRAFSVAMRKAHQTHPDDFDVSSIYVEAIMNITPWKMWDLTTGDPAKNAGTLDAQTVLEHHFETHPKAMGHPGLLHLYVHLMEMSPFPEKALKAADALRELVPDAGHLIHMPTHIDVLCGHYENVVRWNQRAVQADLKYYEAEGAYNIYTGYRQHNYHFIMCGAMYLGQFEPAMAAVRDMASTSPEAMLRIQSPPMADYFETILAMEPHVLIRFGKWQDILNLALPDDRDLFCVRTAFIEYAKGLALAALGHVVDAQHQLKAFQQAKARVPDTRLLHNVLAVDLLDIAQEMLLGEIAYRSKDYDRAFTHLRAAVRLDDGLPYDEPWGWMQPTRHALGALLLEQGHFDAAEQVYREDLGLVPGLSRASVHPDNVWSLKGLYDCLARKEHNDELRHIKLRLDIAMARADVPIKASCGCAQAAMAAH
jgi:tetratricopeptide (TPR) repeat protein